MRKLINISIFLLLFTLSGCYSCKSYYELKGSPSLPPPQIAGKFYWSEECKDWAAAQIKHPPVAKAPPVLRKTKPMTECGAYTVSRSYPYTGCDIIRLEKIMPSEVQLNAPFDYTINVTNMTDMTVDNVVITENIPDNLNVKNANPTATKTGGKIVWKLGTFAPKQSRKITVSGMSTNTDCIKTCATATYVIPACANVKVVQPKLMLEKTAPAEVMLCDPIPIKLVVTNSGTGTAHNVKIEDDLPAGLRTAQGRSKLVFDAGTLASGQSRQFSATLKAAKTGKFVNKAVAHADSGLKAQSETTTIVRQPILTINKTGPERRYLGRSVTYEITVSNKGDAPAENLVVEDRIPAGTRFVSATEGGKAVAGKVSWNLTKMMPNRSRKVGLTLMPDREGTVNNTATAMAKCAENVRASASTVVAGIPAVLLEVIDIEDPIEVGDNETYVITATNQGSSSATNIRIICTLEDNQQYISSSGATRATIEDNVITFAPLRSIAPKEKGIWRVVVKAVKTGDVRFKVSMKTDQLTRPVEETEATHLYE